MTQYQTRFNKVLAYIEANLDLPLNIDLLSQQVHLSKYHFHRQCSAAFGISLHILIKYLRLKRAAYQLAYRGELKIVDIALAAGYESHEAFSRAFNKVFEQSPSAFREDPEWCPWREKYEPILKLRNQVVSELENFSVDVVEFPETPIAVLEHRAAPQTLPNSIRHFIQWRKENALPPSRFRTFNLVYDDPKEIPPSDFRFDLCCEFSGVLNDNDYGVISKVIPAGRCARIRHIGSDDAIEAPVKYLYSQWLSKMHIELRDFPLFFQRVSFFPEVPENEMVTDIYLPIK